LKINKIQKFLEILKQKERMCYLNTLQFDLMSVPVFSLLVSRIFHSRINEVFLSVEEFGIKKMAYIFCKIHQWCCFLKGTQD
jgi:hypothetical protein